MTTTKTYVGDTPVIVLDCKTDISTASALAIEVRKPNGTEVIWPASLSGSTAVQYETATDTLDMPGIWLMQAHVTIGAGVWSGETWTLPVYAAFG